jgi:hypothetical protein
MGASLERRGAFRVLVFGGRADGPTSAADMFRVFLNK